MPDLALPAAFAGPEDGGLSVADIVRALAKRNGVAHEPTPTDAFASDVSRLSDAGVVPDAVEDLLQALTVAGAITHGERFSLHAAYLRESRPG